MDKDTYRFPGSDIGIRDVQKVELEILLEVDRICKEHNIPYQLYSGSLIGAIRHNGFIPWDDDLDICMLREDYERFLDIAGKELSELYFLQTYKTDKNYFNQFAKIRKNNTLFVQDVLSEVEIHHGIYIDVFPLDNVKPNTFLGEVQRRLLNFLRNLATARVRKMNAITKNKINRFFRSILFYILKAVPQKPFNTMVNRIACIFNRQETKFVAELSLSTRKDTYKRFMLERDILLNSIEWEFEGYKFPIPKEYDYVLTRNYGDYMTPPPLEEQIPKHGVIEASLATTSGKE